MTTALETYRKLSSSPSEYFECQLPKIDETEKAVCFDSYSRHLEKVKPVWIPKSQMIILDLGKDSGIRYFIKNWLYSKL